MKGEQPKKNEALTVVFDKLGVGRNVQYIMSHLLFGCVGGGLKGLQRLLWGVIYATVCKRRLKVLYNGCTADKHLLGLFFKFSGAVNRV